MSHVNKHNGFTIVELTLAMGFVSALLLAIAMTVIQIGNIYNRGLTYKNVNQAGGSIASELQRSINSAQVFDLSTNYISKDWGGRLCTSKYSYVWNYGVSIIEKVNLNRNNYLAPNSDSLIRFIKVYDPNNTYCTEVADKLPDINITNSVELLGAGQDNLAIHKFVVTSSESSTDTITGQRIYNIEYSIGTNNQTALKTTLGETSCKEPGEKDSDPTYCSVVRFNIIARAGNVVK